MAANVAILGVGTVGSALLARLEWLQPKIARLRLVHVANSRCSITSARGLAPAEAFTRLSCASPGRTNWECDAFDGKTPSIVIDASGSEDVARRHAAWLSNGVHVVTASKLGQGLSLERWRSIRAACGAGGTTYGDSATVGAGLPLLSSLRSLRDGGDEVTGIAGILSGSMAWLFANFDGLRPFSSFVRQAREAGFTEPDPREDLSGEDVRRKLLILARSAGFPLEAGDVEVESLVPADLAGCDVAGIDDALAVLDVPLRERFADAYKRGERLRHVARFDVSGGRMRARVGVESLSPDHPLATGQGTDNRVAIHCDRYDTQPLVIQGPGAGAAVTAAALLDDVLRIVRREA